VTSQRRVRPPSASAPLPGPLLRDARAPAPASLEAGASQRAGGGSRGQGGQGWEEDLAVLLDRLRQHAQRADGEVLLRRLHRRVAHARGVLNTEIFVPVKYFGRSRIVIMAARPEDEIGSLADRCLQVRAAPGDVCA
jgi:hypothetical protein